MKKLVPVVGVASFLALSLAALADQPRADKRWLHVRVENTGEKAESVRVNVPLDVALKVLPAIKSRELREGRLRLEDARIEGVDIRSVLEAVRTLDDGEFVTIQSTDANVRVAKEAGHLIARVDERTGSEDKISVKIPLRIVDALLSGSPDELNLQAAIQALSDSADDFMVSVESRNESVRVWVDSKSTVD
ncbi:MAG: hypothetical protein ACRD4D_03875 [Candidatus Acidiferrales bacterium]